MARRAGRAKPTTSPSRLVSSPRITSSWPRKSLARMSNGVDALDDDDVFAAFQFANRAMALQRRRSVQVLDKRRGEPVPDEADIPANWRPVPARVHAASAAGSGRPSQ